MFVKLKKLTMENKIVKVDAFRSTDGELFDDETEAQLHQEEIDVTENLAEFINQNYDGSVIKDEVLFDFIFTNRKKLKQIL